MEAAFRRAVLVLLSWHALSSSGLCSTCSTIADGDFLDAGVWDCGCLPSTCDTLLIDHVLTHVGDVVVAADLLRIGLTGSLTIGGVLDLSADLDCVGEMSAISVRTNGFRDIHCSGYMHGGELRLRNDSTFNTGQMAAFDTLEIGQYNEMINQGTLTAGYGWVRGQLYNYGQGSFTTGLLGEIVVNMGSLEGGGAFVFYGIFLNEVNGYIHTDSVFVFASPDNYGTIVTDSTFYAGNEFTGTYLFLYPGSLLTCLNDFYNYGMLAGGGSVCIAGHSENHGTLSGGLDICDVTPTLTVPPYMDVDDGILQGGALNYCENGLCTWLGVGAHDAAAQVSIAPNPAFGHCTVQLPPGMRVQRFDLLNAAGGLVLRNEAAFTGRFDIVPPSGTTGIHALVLHTPNGDRIVRMVTFVP